MIIALTISFISVTNDSAQKGYSLQQAKLENEDLINNVLEDYNFDKE